MVFGCVQVAIVEITNAESLPLTKLIDNYNENYELCISIKSMHLQCFHTKTYNFDLFAK